MEKSGTYRFRICPPAKQSSGGPNQRGIVLPGGFTLIQLSKQGGDGAAPQSDIAGNLFSGDGVLVQEGSLGGAPVPPALEGDSWAHSTDGTDGSVSQESNEDFNFEALSSASFDMDEDVIVRSDLFIFFLSVQQKKPSWNTVNHHVMSLCVFQEGFVDVETVEEGEDASRT